MQFNLVPHPSAPPSEPFKLWAIVDHAAAFGATATLNIWFGVGGPAKRFVLPPPGEPERVDGLWQTTCFEAFLNPDREQTYQEWNFAPSGKWAAYGFDSYREGMRPIAHAATPYIRLEDNLTWWALGATISIEAGRPWRLGLAAVIEEQDGAKSYWALNHPTDKPDFHHDDCFAAKLA